MSAFSRIDAVAAQTMAAVHADPYTLTPMMRAADVKAAPVADTARIVLPGVLGIRREREAKPSIPNAYDRRTDQRPGLESSLDVIEVDPRVQPPGFVDVRAFDLLKGPDGVTWRVAKVNSDAMGRLLASVNLVG